MSGDKSAEDFTVTLLEFTYITFLCRHSQLIKPRRTSFHVHKMSFTVFSYQVQFVDVRDPSEGVTNHEYNHNDKAELGQFDIFSPLSVIGFA